MNKLNTEQQRSSVYNEEPVFYCKHCLSLAIKSIEDFDYCDKCGSTESAQTSIFEWEKIYENKHGIKFLNQNGNGKNENIKDRREK